MQICQQGLLHSRRSSDAAFPHPGSWGPHKWLVVQVGQAEDGSLLSVSLGRPPIGQILQDVARENADLASVGVFAAGPQALVREVRLACSDYNDSWRQPFLDFSSHSFDL